MSADQSARPDDVMASPAASRLENLQILRFFAASLVVWLHWVGMASHTGFNLPAFGIGMFGVDIFFVLSGFVMAMVVNTRTGARLSPRVFFGKRLLRLLPLYWLLTVSLFFASTLVPGVVTEIPSIGELTQSLFFIPYMRDTGLMQPVLFLGWTLNYEIFFYGCFALSLHFSRPALVVVLALAGFVLSGVLFHPGSVIGQFYTDPVLLEFAAGIMCFKTWNILKSRTGWTGAVICASGGVFSVLLFQMFPPGEYHRIIPFIIPAFCIVLGAAMMPPLQGGIVMGPILLGDASYAIYLIHPYVQKLILSISPENFGIIGLTAIMIVLVTGVAIAFFIWFDRPLRKCWSREKSVVGTIT
ncbi:acyltransferase family protein [Halocynthiibacter sp.]|uniref:acyltransferase family protein n=1 Tax=Halocynthiibacter sp. TaxID=1979210 RepID=UPI003C3EDBF5